MTTVTTATRRPTTTYVLTEDLQIWDIDDVRDMMREEYRTADRPVDWDAISAELATLPFVVHVATLQPGTVFTPVGDVLLADGDGNTRSLDAYSTGDGDEVQVEGDATHLWMVTA